MFFHFRVRKFFMLLVVWGLVYFRLRMGLVNTKIPIDRAAIDWIVLAGITMSLAILIAAPKHLATIVQTTVFYGIGAAIGVVFLTEVILYSHHGYDHGFGETADSMFRAGVCGTIAAACLHELRSMWRSNAEQASIM